jgi:hypothetical protein
MPEQQISKGTTYKDLDPVTFTNLNDHVDNAVLLVGAISAQTAAASVNEADSLLIQQNNVLKQATVSQIKQSILGDNYLKLDGSTQMTGQLILKDSLQSSDLQATSFGYVGGNFLNKSTAVAQTVAATTTFANTVTIGASGISLSSGTVTVSKNPESALEVATKSYVDAGTTNGYSAKAVFSGLYADVSIVSPSSGSSPNSGTYATTSTTAITFTFNDALHGFAEGHKLSAVCVRTTGGAVPGIPIIYVVTAVSGNTVYCTPQVTAVINASNGTFTVYKCKLHSSSGITNIIYAAKAAAPADSGRYIVNLSTSYLLDNMCPVVSPSSLTAASNDLSAAVAISLIAPVALIDYATTSNQQITRKDPTSSDPDFTNSFIFSTVTYAAGSQDCGYRSGVVVF